LDRAGRSVLTASACKPILRAACTIAWIEVPSPARMSTMSRTSARLSFFPLAWAICHRQLGPHIRLGRI
jgi:hypothetical protein